MADSVVIAADTIDDSSDNVLAETVNGLYKSEVIHSESSTGKPNYNVINDVELVTLECAALRT